jgi:peptidoglycan/xylan/chitin deacetylase (PgdA/CDA1 family)
VSAAVAQALRLDDVGAASKRHEVYGVTRVKLGRLALPFPGNFLFLKYLPPMKRWGPYRELTAPEWERVLIELEAHGARMTVGVTAGWVETDGRIVPFPRKFPDAAATVRGGVERGLLEVANHGYTHCVLERGRYRPRLFSGNRREHREFHDWLPAEIHREHVTRAQGILQDFLGAPVLTFVPPGNVFARATLAAAAAAGLRYVSCLEPGRWGAVEGITFVGAQDVVSIHDRDLVLGGVGFLTRLLSAHRDQPFVTVREVGARLEDARR